MSAVFDELDVDGIIGWLRHEVDDGLIVISVSPGNVHVLVHLDGRPNMENAPDVLTALRQAAMFVSLAR